MARTTKTRQRQDRITDSDRPPAAGSEAAAMTAYRPPRPKPLPMTVAGAVSEADGIRGVGEAGLLDLAGLDGAEGEADVVWTSGRDGETEPDAAATPERRVQEPADEPPVPDRDAGEAGSARAGGTADAVLPRNAASSAQRVYFQYRIDEVSDRQIEGWITRTHQPSHRCIVVLKEGSRRFGRTIASRFRADLAAAGIGDGCNSFVMPMPSALLDGEEHLLEIFEQETGFPLSPEPIRWRCQQPVDQTASAGGPARNGAARLFALEGRQGTEGGPIQARSVPGDFRPPVPDLSGSGKRSAPSGSVGTRLLFDISDLIYYIGEHANLTGIQRVQSSIVLSIVRHGLFAEAGLTFLSFNAKTRAWMAIPTGFLVSLLEDLFVPENRRLVSFPAEQARYGVLPGAREFTGAGLLDDGGASVLCLLGAAWVHQDYLHRVLALKRRFGTRFVMTVHDLIPIYARETCDQDTARVFEEFMRRLLPHTDHILSVSDNTAADVKLYTQSLQIATPPITVTRNGSSFAEFLPAEGAEGELRAEDVPERFVLFVATIEGRKNHDLMLRIWQRMVADGEDPPHLICVGRLGWKSSAFIAALVESDYLDGRIHLLRDISDTDLRLLYDRCLFTVCPTLYEGWGLPIGESLAMGKICVSSDRASVPEVAGDFGVYIDIDDFEGALAAIREMIADEPRRKRLEAKIRRGYKPVTWRSVAEKVVEACLAAARTEWPEPYPYTAIPYSAEISFARLDRHVDGTGELLLSRIAGARKGVFLSEPLKDRAFQQGEEARSGGAWAYPEDWGTWACHAGGDITLALPQNDSVLYYVVLRLRASGPMVDRPIRISANGEPAWQGSIGPHSRDIVLRVRRKFAGIGGGWRLHLRAQTELTAELRSQIAAIDARMPTIGFERLIVVPENDLKTRLDILYSLLL